MTTLRRADDDASGDRADETESKPIVLPIEDTLDLHTFAPRDVRDVVHEYLTECSRRGWREVRIIHGRGTGTQRATIRSLLARHPLVKTFGDAPPERGGWGATIVWLTEAPKVTRDHP